MYTLYMKGGYYWFNLIDTFIGGFPLLITGLIEIIALIYIYGSLHKNNCLYGNNYLYIGLIIHMHGNNYFYETDYSHKNNYFYENNYLHGDNYICMGIIIYMR